jgi:hypothetical protein
MRIAKRLLRRVRDFAEVAGEDGVSLERTRAALDQLGIDELGLDRRDRAILRAMVEGFAGGPVGLDTLATAVGEDRGTLEEVHEPYLIQRGLMQRTARGRVATEAAYRHLGLPWTSSRRRSSGRGERRRDRGLAARRPLTDVVQVVAAGRKDGVLRVERGERRAQVWFDRGRLRAATLEGGTHLGEMLVRLDLLDVDEVQTLLAEQAEGASPDPARRGRGDPRLDRSRRPEAGAGAPHRRGPGRPARVARRPLRVQRGRRTPPGPRRTPLRPDADPHAGGGGPRGRRCHRPRQRSGEDRRPDHQRTSAGGVGAAGPDRRPPQRPGVGGRDRPGGGQHLRRPRRTRGGRRGAASCATPSRRRWSWC